MEESYKCRICFKSFINGKALGGHMRSHTHPMPILDHEFVLEEDEEEKPSQLSDETESDVSSEEEDDHGEEDGESSETNVIISKKSLMTRKRSKRTRKLESFVTITTKKTKTSQLGYESELHPNNSSEAASDTTTEEDLAFCLMMLSRDKWKNKKKKNEEEEIETEEEEEEDYNNNVYGNKSSKIGKRYKCETCGKVFKSYQALGGHRASHKKNRVCNNNKTEQRSEKTEYGDNGNVIAVTEKRIHQCPICFRVFASGQALGGHKRSHGIGNLSVNHHNHHRVHKTESVKQRMIDLNLPAPNEEEEEEEVVSTSVVLFQ